MDLSFLKKVKKKQIMTFMVVACFFILVGYSFIFLKPVISKLTFLFQNVSELRIRLGTAEISINSMPKLKREI